MKGLKLWKKLNYLIEDDNAFKGLLSVLLTLILITIVFRMFCVVSLVEGTSMEPNFHTGDLCVSVRARYVKEYKRGDVVMTYIPTSKTEIIKRVVGLPGEYVEVKYGRLYIDGAMVEEKYASKKSGVVVHEGRGDRRRLKEDELFLLGDNRDNSFDCRYFGPIKIKDIHYKFLFKIKEGK